METSIFRYILKHSLRDQIILLALTAFSMPFLYVSLDIPKMIVNEAIGGEDIPDSIFGYEIDQIDYLIILCGIFLTLVVFNGGLKYILNVYRGVLGERMLRRLRYELYVRILRFPLPHFKRVSQGEIIPMITAETEPLGGFIGEAFALPAMQGGILLTYLFFIYNQDLILGVAATALYPFQLYLIPKLQRKINALSKRRVLAVRKLADRVGESVSGISEIHAHDTSQFERADISERLGNIYRIRYEIYRRKFFIKFLNNFLAQITPFFFYLAGGYFVIQGELTLGALIAVLAAYKDLASPWAEILKYYQMKEDIRVKYGQIVEQFQPPNMIDEALIDDEPKDLQALAGAVMAANLVFSEDDVVRVVDGVSCRFPVTDHVATIGVPGCGKDELARLMARLLAPTGGRLSIGDANLAELPESVLGRRMAYVGSNSHIFSGTVRDNLLYGLKHRPLKAAEYDAHTAQQREAQMHDSRRAGNSTFDIHADWLDYQAAGAADFAELEARAIELFSIVELEGDMYQLGLRSTINPAARPELADKVLRARSILHEQISRAEAGQLVEAFEASRYNSNATVAENLLFGTPRDATLKLDHLAHNEYVLQVLDKVGLRGDLVEMGRRIAETMVDLFADLPPGHEFFEQFSFISAEELPDYQALLARINAQGMESIGEAERQRLLSLAFLLIPARHRLGLIDESMQARLLEARRVFADELPEQMRQVIEFFNADRYNATSTLQDNILFGKRVYGQPHAMSRLGTMIEETVDELDLRSDIIRVGLDYETGIGGARLTGGVRQKIAIVRCLLKKPDLLIINQATDGLDPIVEARILQQLRTHMEGRGIVWVLSKVTMAREFDRVLVLDDGKLIEQGTIKELEKNGTTFQRLLEAS